MKMRRPFVSGGDMAQQLDIWLFVELVHRGKRTVDLGDHDRFELTEALVAEYDRWVATGAAHAHRIDDFLKQESDYSNRFDSLAQAKVTLWADRDKSDYYKAKLQQGFLFENWVAQRLKDDYGLDIGMYLDSAGQYDLGENALGIEIKNDSLYQKTGNLYFEYAERSNADRGLFVPSGIMKVDDCHFYLIGDEAEMFIFRKSRLQEIYAEESAIRESTTSSPRGAIFRRIATSKGITIPVDEAVKESVSFDEMVGAVIRLQCASARMARALECSTELYSPK